MNSLGLRGSGNAKVKLKGSGGKDLELVYIPHYMIGDVLQAHHTILTKCSSGDEQFQFLTNFIKRFNKSLEPEQEASYSYFLALIWFYSNSSHPFKPFLCCFMSKHVKIQIQFINSLKKIFLMEIICIEHRCHRFYDVIANVNSCTESPVTKQLLPIIAHSCMDLVNNSIAFCCLRLKSFISPTDKNRLYQLAHSTVRATLHVLLNPGTLTHNDFVCKCRPLVKNLIWLMGNNDVPMDNKCVGAILYLQLYLMEFGAPQWIHMLGHEEMSEELKELTKNEFTQLVLYSAVISFVHYKLLIETFIDDVPAILVLAQKITAYGDKYIQEPSFVLCVSRTVAQMSVILHKIEDVEWSLKLSEVLQIYLWTHIDSHLDSVRYLATETLNQLVRHAAGLHKQGQTTALSNLLVAILSLTNNRKAYFLSLTEVVKAVGTEVVLNKIPNLVKELIDSLNVQAVKSSASTTLEAILDLDKVESEEHIYGKWIQPIMAHIGDRNLDSSVLKILGSLIAKILKRDKNIIYYILQEMTSTDFITLHTQLTNSQLKCVLVLLNTGRKVAVISDVETDYMRKDWKEMIDYRVIRHAAINPFDEIRLLAITLIVETPKTSELILHEDYEFILHFLKFNMNTQSPVYRQQMLAHLMKFMKRLEDTYKSLIRDEKRCELEEFKIGLESFVENLRMFCIDSLVVGANYSRRTVALQCLLWTQVTELQDYTRKWQEEYVQQLLIHLDDSYENIKSTALQILNYCPKEILTEERYAKMLNLETILEQASSIKPTDCVSAAYKLKLLRKKIPEYISHNIQNSKIPEPATYYLIEILMGRLSCELETAKKSMLLAASHAPMYGTVHCIAQMLTDIDYTAIATDNNWTDLIDKIINMSRHVIAEVSRVVNNSSPEGHLPMDFEPGALHLPDSAVHMVDTIRENMFPPGLPPPDSCKMTAQRVLLCAWRSVKEVSLLIAQIASEFLLKEESEDGSVGNITKEHLVTFGTMYTSLLTETKHRGAFEQAYVGFTKLLQRLWRCKVEYLHNVPSVWLSQLLTAIFDGDNQMCGTRRSAGLPFMIQGLVTVEVQVSTNPLYFNNCMNTLLNAAQEEVLPATERSIENCVHSMNILRTLFKHAGLANAVAKYVSRGMIIAISGFMRSTWAERNSATLLLSALMVRVFGVPRSREQDTLSLRNRMTGRIFFLKYPEMYDFMLGELTIACDFEAGTIRPSLVPLLLILSRLYPSSLEGTTTNLKLVAYVPYVGRCANCPIMLVRKLAATAIVPLVPTLQYGTFINETFDILAQPNHTMNYYHGKMMQLVKLMDGLQQENMDESIDNTNKLATLTWVLRNVETKRPCYLLIDEYLKLINLCLWHYPQYTNPETINEIKEILSKILRSERPQTNLPGRDVCIASAMSVYLLIVANSDPENLPDVIISSMSHYSYEVILAILNYILILYDKHDEEKFNSYEKHWKELTFNSNLLEELRNNTQYVDTLCDIFKSTKHLECTQKSLKILTYEENTQSEIIAIKFGLTNASDEDIINLLIECIEFEHDTLTAIYLSSLLKFVSMKLDNGEFDCALLLRVLRITFECSTSDNSDDIRAKVVTFMNSSIKELFNFNYTDMDYKDIFEARTTLWAVLAILLEDDNEPIRTKMSSIIMRKSYNYEFDVTPSVCGEHLVERLGTEGNRDNLPILLIMALVDFRVQVCLGDKDDHVEEGRVFDQNEKYNVFMEESILSVRCIKKMREIYYEKDTEETLRDTIIGFLNDDILRPIFVRLCGDNLKIFETLLHGQEVDKDTVYNPKVDVVFDMVR